jgi:lipoyl(octanoyl) transferase
MASIEALIAPAAALEQTALVRRLGRTGYEATYDAMRRFNDERTAATRDEIWLTEHSPVYTVGISGREEHFPRSDSAHPIPLKRIDRGGQITYHGPGQAIAYVLIDLVRRNLKVRGLVAMLEQAVIDVLGAYNVRAVRTPGAPGVYVDGAKIAALGLRVRRGCSYHGIAFNIDMDLSPFHAIDPCGYPGLAVTDCRTLGLGPSVEAMSDRLAEAILVQLRKA